MSLGFASRLNACRTRHDFSYAVDRRQQRGVNDYVKRARELDRQIPGHQPDEEGPFTKELESYGDNG